MTVLVPKSHASSTRGASVSSTSHSGMTMLSSTWLVPSTPSPVISARKGRFLSAAGLTTASSATAGLVRAGGSGSRVIQKVLASRTRPVRIGTPRTTASLLVASARPPIRAPTVKPMLSAARMKACDCTRSSRVNTSIV